MEWFVFLHSVLILSVCTSLSADKQGWLQYFYSEDRDSGTRGKWPLHSCIWRNGGRRNRCWRIREALSYRQLTRFWPFCSSWIPFGKLDWGFQSLLASIITRFPSPLHPSSPRAYIYHFLAIAWTPRCSLASCKALASRGKVCNKPLQSLLTVVHYPDR